MNYFTSSDLDTALNKILGSLDAEQDFGTSPDESQYKMFTRLYGRLRVEAIKGLDDIKSLDKAKPRKLPVWYNPLAKTYIPIVPDQKAGGLLFAITTDAAKVIDPSTGWSVLSHSQTKQYSLALIGWWDTSQSSRSIDEVRLWVENLLGKSFDWQTTRVEDQLATKIFAGLEYDFQNYSYMLYPFGGFRIEGTLTVTESVCN